MILKLLLVFVLCCVHPKLYKDGGLASISCLCFMDPVVVMATVVCNLSTT